MKVLKRLVISWHGTPSKDALSGPFKETTVCMRCSSVCFPLNQIWLPSNPPTGAGDIPSKDGWMAALLHVSLGGSTRQFTRSLLCGTVTWPPSCAPRWQIKHYPPHKSRAAIPHNANLIVAPSGQCSRLVPGIERSTANWEINVC